MPWERLSEFSDVSGFENVPHYHSNPKASASTSTSQIKLIALQERDRRVTATLEDAVNNQW